MNTQGLRRGSTSKEGKLSRRRRIFIEQLEDRRLLAAVTVNSTSDVDDGDTSSITALNNTPGPDGVISLREAIIAANSTSGPDEVVLPAGTYLLTIQGVGEDAAETGDLDVTDSLTITGAGLESTIIDASGLDPGGDSAFGDRVLHVLGVDLSVTEVTLRGGNLGLGDGGGLLNDLGSVTLTGVDVVDNRTTERGGGVATIGSDEISQSGLILDDVVVANNFSSGGGGGIFAENDQVRITNNSLIRDNVSQSDGGGILFNSTVVLGAVDLTQFEFLLPLEVSDSSVIGNQAEGNGGGISNVGGNVVIQRSTISGNTANNGGGIHSDSGISNLNVRYSTISDNAAGGDGGGLHNEGGPATIINSTIAGNEATGSGGGILVGNGGQLLGINTTITENRADNGVDFDPQDRSQGGGIYRRFGGLAEIRNTIVALNVRGSAGSDGGDDLGGDAAGPTILVADAGRNRGEAARILAVNPDTGDRAVFSDEGTGTGPDFERDGPRGIELTPGGDILVTDQDLQALFVVDAATGDRLVLSDAANGAGPDFERPRGVLFVAFLAGVLDSNSSFNIIGVDGVSGLTDGVNGNQVGTAAAPIAPLLGALAANGGPTFTHAPLVDSPSITPL